MMPLMCEIIHPIPLLPTSPFGQQWKLLNGYIQISLKLVEEEAIQENKPRDEAKAMKKYLTWKEGK